MEHLLEHYQTSCKETPDEIVSTVTSKGQVTIPAEVRAYLGIKTHDKIAFVIDQEGIVRLRVPRYPAIVCALRSCRAFTAASILEGDATDRLRGSLCRKK